MKRIISAAMLLLCAAIPLFCLDVQRDIVEKSRQYVGCVYSRGGVNPPQFDCSGFVGYIIRPFVPNLPRLSKDMSESGVKISRDDLAPGDLVFFATTEVPGAVSHVALYIGGGSIIHAISDGPDRGVNITPLSSRYWKEHYHSAVRVLPAGAQTAGSAETKTGKSIQFAKGTYTGSLRGNEPDGQGILALNNGDSYSGSFIKGQFEGTGTYRWADGSTYEGQFKAGVFHGKGILTGVKGTKQAVAYDNGKLIPPAAANTGKAAPKSADTAAATPQENYLQKADSPWDTWTGYISGDYDQWKAQQQKDFEKAKKAYDKDKEKSEFEEWKKTQK